MEHKTKSGAVFVDPLDAERWEDLETAILVDDSEFKIFTERQWKFLNTKIPPIINRARKGM